MHKFEKISTVKLLFFFVSGLFILSCSSPEGSRLTPEYGDYQSSHHQENWDTKAFYILSDFQNLQASMSTQDTMAIYTAVKIVKATTDTLLSTKSASDSLTQNIWMGGLVNFSNELEALIQEKELSGMNDQFQMCAYSLLHLLSSIGYQKTNVYIFQTQIQNKDIIWIANSKMARNPFNNKDRNLYSANHLLQSP
jgi:hypothetical protein